MTLLYANRVHEACSASGVQNLTLIGALSGKSTFTSKIPTGSLVPYVLLDGNGVDWECGYGTLASATELQRTTVKDSSATEDRVNSEADGTPIKLSLTTNQHEVFIAPFDKTVFSKDEDGQIADPSAIRASLFVDTIADMTALTGLINGETVFVRGDAALGDALGGCYRWDSEDATSESNPETYAHDTIGTGLFKKVRYDIQGIFRSGDVEVDAKTADSVGASLYAFFRKKATLATAWARWHALYNASEAAFKLGIRHLQSASEKFFLGGVSTGDNFDRAEIYEPVVLPSRANTNGFKARALSWLSGSSRLAMAQADAAGSGSAADAWDIPLTKGFLACVVPTITALKAVDPVKFVVDGDRALVLGTTAIGDQPPFFVQWSAASTATANDWSVFRPSVGTAATGDGRWLRIDVSPSRNFANSDATPSIANGSFFVTAGTPPAAITDFDDAHEGQLFVVQRGTADQTITHNASVIDLGGFDLTLTASKPRALFKHVNGVHRLLSGSAASLRGAITGDELGAVADDTADDRAAYQAAETRLGPFGGELRLPGGRISKIGENGSNDYCLRFTAPISIVGMGGAYSALKPDSAIGSDVVNLLLEPNAGYSFRLTRYQNLFFGNPNGATREGGIGIKVDGTAPGAIFANALLEGINVHPGGDVALSIVNDDSDNVTGQAFCTELRRSLFARGIDIRGGGDNFLASTIVTYGDGLGFYWVGTEDAFGNGPSQVLLINYNSTCEDGAFKINRSRFFACWHSNVEQIVANASGYMGELEPEVRDAAKTITGVTNANPGVFTVAGHGYSNGDDLYLPTLTGMSGLVGRYFKAANVDTNTFTLTTIFGVPVDTTALGSFSAGTVQKVTHRAGPHYMPDISFTAFGAGTGAGLAAMLRVGSTLGGQSYMNSFNDGGSGATADIVIEADTRDFYCGPAYTTRSGGLLITDNGIGTRGVTKDASLQNSWVDFGSSLAVVQFVKDSDALVHITGTCKNGTTTASTVIFTLPEGFRPAAILRAMVLVDDGGGYTVPGFVIIQTNGEVQIGYVPTAGGANAQAISFNITFRAANGNSIIKP